MSYYWLRAVLSMVSNYEKTHCALAMLCNYKTILQHYRNF